MTPESSQQNMDSGPLASESDPLVQDSKSSVASKGLREKLKQSAYVRKHSNKDTWYCGYQIRTAVVVHCCALTFTLITQVLGEILCSVKGNSTHSKFYQYVVIPVAALMLLATITAELFGLIKKSHKWMNIAAWCSGILFVGSVAKFFATVFVKKFWINENSEDGTSKVSVPWVQLVINVVIVFLAFSNIFNCISYRNYLRREEELLKGTGKTMVEGQPVIKPEEP